MSGKHSGRHHDRAEQPAVHDAARSTRRAGAANRGTATIERPSEGTGLPGLQGLPGPSGPDFVSATGAGSIVPRGRARRRAAREEEQGRRRKRLLAIAGGVLVLALIAWAVVSHSGGSTKGAGPASQGGRTQTTVLVQVDGALGDAVDSALIAHDSAEHAGVMVLVPSAVIAQVPGFGPMAFGKASTLGQADAPRAALSDLLGVTIDGSWTLSQGGLQALVDKVGGIEADVDKDVTAPAPNGATAIVVPAGHQRLDGKAAVAFATFLDGSEVEQARLARFDEVFGAVLKKLPKQPGAVAQILAGLGAGSTSTLPTTRLSDVLVGLAADAAATSTVDTVLPVTRLDTGGETDAFSVDRPKAAALVQQNLAQSIPAHKLVTGNRVMVKNQVGTPGIGQTTRDKLINAGFTYVAGENAPGMPNATAPSVVLITGTTAADIAKGNAVAKALGLPTSDVRVSKQSVEAADVIVLIGADYKP